MIEMAARFRQILSPPVFEDDEKTRVAGLLHVILLVIGGIVLLNTARILLFAPQSSPSLGGSALTASLLLVLWTLARRGYVKLASLLLCALWWAGISLALSRSGGPLNPNFGGNLVVIMMVGLLLGRRYVLVFLALGILVGLLNLNTPLQRPVSPVQAWASLSIVFAISAGFLYVTLNSLEKALARAREGERALNERNQELQRQIAERERSERQLRYQATLLENVSDAVIAVSMDSLIQSWNRAAENIYGWQAAEVLGKPSSEIVPTDYLGESRESAVRALLETGFWKGELVQTRRDGSAVFVLSSASLLRDDQGRPSGIVTVNRDITERKQAEEALRESENKFRALFLSAPQGVVIVDQEGVIILVNTKTEVMFGYDPGELTGQPLEVLLPEPLRDLHVRHRQDYLAAPRIRDMGLGLDLVGRRKDGGEFPIEVGLSYVDTKDGTLLMGFISDISEHRRAQEALRESEARLRTVLQNMPVMLDAFDEAGNLIVWNRECERVTGYSAEQVVNNPDALQLLYPDAAYRQRMLAEWEARGNDYRNWEWNLVAKDGQVRTIAWSNISDRFPVPGWAVWGIGVDVTERVRVESELQQTLNTLEQRVEERTAELVKLNSALAKYAEEVHDLYNNAPCGYHSLDGEGVCIRINDTELEWLGYTRDEIIGKKFTEFFTPDSVKIFQVNFPLFKERGWVRDLELDLVRKDGSILPVLLNATAIKDGSGNFVMSRSTLFDITERKRAEDHIKRLNAELEKRALDLETANKELEAFSYSVSHDLRAPLRAIDGFSRILLEDYAPHLPPEAQRYLGLVRSNTQQMGRLIADLLNLSRLSRQPMTKQMVNPGDLARQALETLKVEMEGRQVDIAIRDLPPCHADPILLRQVYLNLLQNALKFTGKRDVAQIEVGCKEQEGEKVYFVRDNGVGFDMQYVHKIFGVFQRLHRAEDYEGSGVGLATVQRIIRRHGGQVWAEGEVDGGATFYFTVGADDG